MRFFLVTILALTVGIVDAQDQKAYQGAYQELRGMLTDSIPMSFKRAVFITENAYMGNLSYPKYEGRINDLADLCRQMSKQKLITYTGSDKDEVKKYASVFRLMTDTVKFLLDSSNYLLTTPYTYDFDDFLGETNWKKMFVSKLLTTHSGNCHSLPFLYKILCEEIGAKAYLAMAPNHIYIKQWTNNCGWFNTELTSKYFPIDAWIMASGYISLTSVQNRLYMDTLSEKKSIAVCLIDLAKGHDRKFPQDFDFTEKCINTAISYYPNYVNGLIYRAELKKKRFENMMIIAGANYATQIFNDKNAKMLFDEMERDYFEIHQLGFRTMPKEMYINWLAELTKEKKKYGNEKIIQNLKPAQSK